MPINPAIALGVKSIELPDPAAMYAKELSLRAAQQQNQLAQMQMQEYQRSREEEQAVRNRLAQGAGVEDAETRNFLLGSKTGRDILKQQSEFQKSQTEESARRAKLMADTETMYRNMAGQIGSKDDAIGFLQQMIQDPALQGSPITRIPIEMQIARIPNDPQGLDNWMKQFAMGSTKWVAENKPTTQVIDQGGQRQIVQIPGMGGAPTTVGTYADVPLPADVVAQKERVARAGAANVTVGAEKEYLKKGAGVAGEADIAQIDAAPAIQSALGKVDETLSVLRKGNVNTGLGAEVFTTLDRARAQFAADKKAGKRVEDTQYLDALLGSEVFPLIQQLGIGARGMDTPAEREFLRKVMTGTINLDKNTLIRMAELRKKALTDQATRYNSRLESGELDAMLEATHRTKRKIEIPKGGMKPAGKTVTRTGTMNGRRVIQYSDGSIEYAD